MGIAILLLAFATGTAHATTWSVPGDFSTVQAAVDASSGVCGPVCDTVVVAAGTWDGRVVVTKSVTLVANGSATLRSAHDTSAVEVDGGGVPITVRLEGFRVDNPGTGTALRARRGARVTAVDLVVTDQVTNGDGAAFRVESGASLDLVRGVFRANTADAGGHGEVDAAGLTATGTVFETGTAARGGALWLDTATTRLVDCTFVGGQATGTHDPDRGGALYVDKGTLDVSGGTFSGNGSQEHGGHLAARSGAVVALSGGVTFELGTAAARGGSVHLDDAHATLSDATFLDGIAGEDGGHVYARRGTLAVSGTTVSGGQARNGGGFALDAVDARLVGVLVEAGGASQLGGGIHAFDGALVLEDGVVADNTAGLQGGGLALSQSAEVRTTTFARNEAGWGGAIAVPKGGLSLLGVELDGNLATADGGGVWVDSAASGPFKFAAVDAHDNLAQRGGAIHANAPSATFAIADSLFTHNDATTGGALYGDRIGVLVVSRSVWCGNTAQGAGGAAYLVDVPDQTGQPNQWMGSVLVDNVSSSYGGALHAIRGHLELSNDHVIGNTGGGVTVSDVGPKVVNVLFGWNTPSGLHGVGLAPALGAYTYDAWYGNPAAVSGTVLVTALLVGHQFGAPALADYPATGCDAWRWVPSSGSPLVNRGDPNQLDPDGSRSDIGAYGGAGGLVLTDADNDGWMPPLDCDDTDPARNPGMTEKCDPENRDEDCDGLTNEGDPSAIGLLIRWMDEDLDGWGNPTSAKAYCFPGPTVVDRPGDCDDGAPGVNPDAQEVCDPLRIDEDCDGLADDADGSVTGGALVYPDLDGDGYGDAGTPVRACVTPPRHTADGRDCDDGDAAIHPGATEACDPLDVDEDCDGLADDDDAWASGAVPWYADADGDGWGDPLDAVDRCDPTVGRVARAGDCDDTARGVSPDAIEVCDPLAVDEDCDGLADDADPSVQGVEVWYLDADADGWGDPHTTTTRCRAPTGWTAAAGDCDDGAAEIHPAADERCDDGDVDEDCDGLADDDDDDALGTTAWFVDADGDGWGAGVARDRCEPLPDAVQVAGDCDDARADVHPGAVEVCDPDDTDEDCDGLADDDDGDAVGTTPGFVDADLDGWGDPTAPASRCDPGPGWTATAGDCDDRAASVHPGATETCDDDQVDEDCDGVSDDDDPDVTGQVDVCPDQDGDGFGDPGGPTHRACPTGAGPCTDCDDLAGDVHPGADEIWYDGADQDCDGNDDDRDGDGWAGPKDRGEDCHDADPTIHPGATERPDDGVDQDCDGFDVEDHWGNGFAVAGACGCAGAGGPGGASPWWFALCLLLWRRR